MSLKQPTARRAKRPPTIIEMIEDLQKRLDGMELDMEVLWEDKDRRDKAKSEELHDSGLI